MLKWIRKFKRRTLSANDCTVVGWMIFYRRKGHLLEQPYKVAGNQVIVREKDEAWEIADRMQMTDSDIVWTSVRKACWYG
jgi:hypothetical protein